jgi:hypothetical protein
MRTIDKRHGHTPTEEELKHRDDVAICEAVESALWASVVMCVHPRKPGAVINKLPRATRELLRKSKAEHYQYTRGLW